MQSASRIARAYTTLLPIEEYYPDAYETWTLRLEGTTVVSERTEHARSAEVEDDWDEDAYSRSAPARAEQRYEDVASALQAVRREVARELPRLFDATADAREALVVGPPELDVESKRWIRTDDCAAETPALDETGRALLAAAARDATDGGSRLVFADWLAGRDDPSLRALGELAVVHQGIRQSAGDPDPDLLVRARALLETHADEWLSGLLPYARVGFRLGLLDSVELLSTDALAATTSERELAALLSLPIASGLRRLVIGAVGEIAISGNPFVDLAGLVDALGSTGHATLRELVIGGEDDAGFSLSTDAGDLSFVWTTLPSLERFDVYGFVQELGKPRGPRLVHLGVHYPSGDDEVQSIAGADLPSLQSLVFSLYGREAQLQMLRPLFEGSGVPRLHRLELRVSSSPASRVLDLISGTPLLERLETLEVVSSRSGYATSDAPDDAGFDSIVASPRSFLHLESLKVVGTALGDARRDELLRALPNLVLE